MGLRGLEGMVVVVAGGATGIGAATSKRLADEGCAVVVGDVVADGARRTTDEITEAGGTATAVAFDLAEPDSVVALFETAARTYGGVDASFNVGADMGALRGDSDVVDIELDLWDRVMAVNLRGYVVALKSAIPLMLKRGGGAIVNMSSAAAFQGEPTRPAYATAKAGIGALTRMSRPDGVGKGSGATPSRRDSLRQKRFDPSHNGRIWRRPPSSASAATGSVAQVTSHHWSRF